MTEPQLYFIYLPFSQLKFTKRQISDIAHRCVLNIASRNLRIPVESLYLGLGEFGKPYIQNHENWHFNISHTDGIIVIAVSDKPVGVDVERIRKADLRIAKRFFTEKEIAYIDELAEKQDERFFEVWTKKEAYLKYTGDGLRVPLESIDVISYCDMYKSLLFDGFIVTICKKPNIDNR